MLTFGTIKQPLQTLFGIVALAFSISGISNSSIALAQSNTTTPTTISISDTPKLTNAKRLGINLGTQNFWDSGMIMRNLAFRNPGFEGETWQTIMHCKAVTSTSCTDDNTYTYWPANFLANATASFIVGPAAGTVANVTSSTAATIGVLGTTVQLSGLSVSPSVGDYLVVRRSIPGNGQAGWWTQSIGGATFATETNDLSSETPGKQALAMNASGANQQAILSNYDDGIPGRIFLHLNGSYTVSFRAKGTGGNNQVKLSLVRNVVGPPAVSFWNQTVTLSNTWQDYSFTFQVTNDVNRPGSIGLGFNATGSSMLIDDVSFAEVASPDNPTAYRNAVFETLKTLHPGTIRYMDGGFNWGSSFDNLLAPDFARTRSGYSNAATEIDDIAMGLHDFLVLCQAVGADPWFTMSPGMTTQEMSNMMDYFGGSTSTVYGAKRAALGQTAPWTTVFGQIHLEFGNEVWNTGNPGANLTDPASYGKRAGVIFGVAKASPSYSAKSFDLVLDGFEAVTYWTQTALANSANYDTVSTATYNYGNFNDASSSEAIFGPMLSEPEYMNNATAGLTNQQALAAATAGSKPAKLAVYETNIGTQVGSVTQAQVQSAIPSIAAGISVGVNMLIAQRDLGVTVQNMFALEGYNFQFSPSAGSPSTVATTTPIWGVTIDMGGATNLQRPMFLAEQLANTAILPKLLTTSQAGLNPTWNQPYTTNDNFSLPGAHYIQSVAYTDGTTLNVVLFNLSRTTALPVNFAGLNAPVGTATMRTLTAASIIANNESAENVVIKTSSQSLAAGATLTLPPFSMTVLSMPAPVVPVQVYSVTGSCADTSLSINDTTTCTAAVTGQGKYNTGVTWSAVSGKISSNGAYTAPAAYPASGKDVVTATAIGDTSKTSSVTVYLAPDTVTGVTASCPVKTLGQGKTVSCTATVAGTGSFSNNYTWSTTGGTITANGGLTAPATGTSVTLTATSVQDRTKSGSVTIQLTPVLVMGQVSSTSTGTTAVLSWTLNMPAYSGVSYGTSPGTGITTPYVATQSTTPSVALTGLLPSTTYYVSAFSFVGNQTVSQNYNFTTTNNTATITGVTVNCAAASLLLSASTGCSATVAGTGNYSSAVTWKTSLGTISSTGVLVAPSSLLGSTIVVTATSVQDKTKSGTDSVALDPPPTVTSVMVACQATTINDGSSTTCLPTVTGTGNISKSVTWTASAGTITTAGVLTAPKTGSSVTVTATSVQDKTKSASTLISLTPAPTITGVTVSCQLSSVILGGSTNCASTVAGTGSYVSSVAWTTSGGTITSAGVLTTPTAGTSITVKATSTQDTTKSGTAVITLQPTLTITNPKVVIGTGTLTVSWTVNNSQAHSGVTYAPAGGTYVTTSYDPNATSTPSYQLTGLPAGTVMNLVLFSYVGGASVSLNLTATMPAAAPTVTSVSVSCASPSLVAGKSEACSAAVGGTGKYSTAVTWSTSGGSITAAGVLTAPTTGTSVTVKATSTADPTKSASTNVSVTAAAKVSGVKISCPDTVVAPGAKITCSASVTGTGAFSSAVNWSASAGSVTNTGVVTAPVTGTSITLIATSAQDSTQSATSTIAISQKLAIVNPTFFATSTTIVVSWSVTQKTYNGVNYNNGPGTNYSTTPYDSTATSTPSFTFTGLKPGTTYKANIFSYNSSGTVAQDITVTTPLN